MKEMWIDRWPDVCDQSGRWSRAGRPGVYSEGKELQPLVFRFIVGENRDYMFIAAMQDATSDKKWHIIQKRFPAERVRRSVLSIPRCFSPEGGLFWW